ncbi:unnamed protein product, partial [Rhizopus stolonifer]
SLENKSSLSEAEKFLESLNLTNSGTQESQSDSPDKPTTDPNEIMSFLDEITNYPTTDTKQELKKKEASINPPSDPQQPDRGWMSGETIFGTKPVLPLRPRQTRLIDQWVIVMLPQKFWKAESKIFTAWSIKKT